MAGHGRSLAILGAVLVAGAAATAWLVLSDTSHDGGDATGGPAANETAGGAGAAAERPKRPGSATVFGEIRRSAGKKPVAGQEVRLAPKQGEPWSVTTDARGAFRFEQVPHGGPYEFTAAAPGCGTIRIPGIALDRNEKRNLGTLWLDPSVKVTVRVRDGADAPVAGARVEAFVVPRGGDDDWSKALAQVSQTPIAVMSATTDESGDTSFPETAVGSWTITASKEGYATGGHGIDLRAGEEPRPVTIRLTRGHPLDGRVLDSAGRPVANVLVMAGDGDSAWSPAAAPLRARTRSAEDGRYAFAALASGETTLWVAREGGVATPAVTLRIPRVAHYDVVLPAQGTLRGTVTERANGRPVEGAVVRASSWESSQAHGGETATDAEGRYELAMAAGVVNELTVEKDGLVQVREERRGGSDRVATLQEGAVVVRDVLMERGARLTGVVRGDGAPLEFARVLVAVGTKETGFSQKSAVTDESGRYEYPALTKGTFLLLVEKEGWYQPDAPEQWWEAANEKGKAPAFEVEIPESGEVVRDLEMRRGADVTGTVVGPDGSPLAGARVGALGASESAPTAADGAFRLEGVTPGRLQRFTCRCDGYAFTGSAPTSISADVPTTGVVLRMSAEPHVRGTVTLRDGGVPADARVLVAVEESGGDDMPWTVAWRWQNAIRLPVHADGTFDGAFSPSSEGRLFVRAESDACAPADAKPIPIAAEQDSYEVRLVLEPGAALTGRVTTKSGDALAGADISVAPHFDDADDSSYYSDGQAPAVWAVSGPDGSFEIPHLAAGRYDVRASARGFVPTTKTGASGEGVPLAVALSPELTIEGTVAFADGRPVEGVEVEVETDESMPSFGGLHGDTPSATTDAKGAFRIGGLAEGRWTVTASPPWGAQINVRSKSVENVAAGTSGLAITVEEGGRIRGRVLDVQRRPLARVSVEAGPSGSDDEDDESEDDGWHYATTREDGTFEIVGLGRGPYDLQASDDGGSRRPASRAKVAVGSDGVELVLEEGLTVSGVLVSDGGPLPHVGLTLSSAEGGNSSTLTTDAQGRFTYTGLAPGSYRLSIGRWGGPDQGWLIESQEPVQAGASGLRVVAVRGATIAGVVVDETGAAVGNATVIAMQARSGARVQQRGRTNADGTFEIRGLPRDGKFGVRAIAPGHADARADNVESGTTNLRLVLAAGMSTSGRLSLADGSPGARVTITLSAEGKQGLSTRTDGSGAFTFDKLSAGSYDARVWVEKKDGSGDWKPCGTLRAGDTGVELRVQD